MTYRSGNSPPWLRRSGCAPKNSEATLAGRRRGGWFNLRIDLRGGWTNRPGAPLSGAFGDICLMARIGVGAVVTRPSLRTVQVVFPHTALQSLVPGSEKVKLTRHMTVVIKMIQ